MTKTLVVLLALPCLGLGGIQVTATSERMAPHRPGRPHPGQILAAHLALGVGPVGNGTLLVGGSGYLRGGDALV
jgi:hypothetical protein